MRAALFAVVLSAAILCSTAAADDWGPWETPSNKTRQTASDKSPLQLAVRTFHKYISPVDGPRCPMYPTCSGYSLQALRKHGPLLGVFQTVDRLYREGDVEHEHRQPVNKWGRIRFYDPLEENDFWLRSDPKRNTQTKR